MMPYEKRVSEKSSTHDFIEQVEDKSTLPALLHDTASPFSYGGDKLSKTSSIFKLESDLRSASKVNKEIDKQIRADAETKSREIRILVFGAAESNKSKLLQQMRLLHNDGSFTEVERKQWRAVIFSNLVNGFQALIGLIEGNYISFKDESNVAYAEYIKSNPTISIEDSLPEYALLALRSLWADASVHSTVINTSLQSLHDGLEYFFNDIDRLFTHDYLPTNQDILRTERRTMGITEINFSLEELTYRVFDLGRTAGRPKWIHFFDDMPIVIFTVALSCYDNLIVEDSDVNEMKEAAVFFGSIANSKYFERSRLIILFTELVEFRGKIQAGFNPISKYFREYNKPAADVDAAYSFFADMFTSFVRSPSRNVCVHFVNIEDTSCLKKIMESTKDLI